VKLTHLQIKERTYLTLKTEESFMTIHHPYEYRAR